MATYEIHVDFGSGPQDLTAYLVGQHPVKGSRSIHNGLKPVIGTCDFTINRNVTVVNQFLIASTDPTVSITKNGSPYFTGTVRRTVKVSVGQLRVEALKCQCVDPLYRMDGKKFSSSLVWNGYKISNPGSKSQSILHQLFYMAGYADSELSFSLIDVVVDSYALDGTKSALNMRDLIETVLRDCVYSLKVLPTGVIELYDLYPASYTPTATLATGAGGNIVGGYTCDRDESKAEAVDVTYWDHLDLVGETLFEDTTGATAGLDCSIPVPAGTYFPEGASASVAIRCVFDVKDYDLVSASSPAIDWSHTGDVTKQVETIDGLGMLVRFYSATGGVITKFRILGDATVKKNQNKVSVENVSSSDEREEIRTELLTESTSSGRIAKGRAAWHKNSTYIYNIPVLATTALEPGQIVALSDAGLLGASQNLRVVRIDNGDDEKQYKIAAEGVADYSPTVTAGTPSLAMNSVPVRDGEPGTPGYRTATMTLYKWLTDPPSSSWPTGSSTYTWATGEWTTPATLNGWAKVAGAPSSGQKLYAVALVVTNNNTDLESTVTWLASPTAAVVGYAGTDGIDGDDGTDGFTTEFSYAKNTSATTGPSFTAAADNPGAAWTSTPPTLASTEYLWRIESVWKAGIRQTNWTGLVRMSGINAKNILNSFQDASDGTTGWTTSGVIETVDSYRCLAVTAPDHNFQSDNFEVLPDDILELSFAIATPVHTGGSGIFLGLTSLQQFQKSQWNNTTKTWGTLGASSSNQYFVTSYLTAAKTFFKTYILGSNVDISRAPAPETGAGHSIGLLKLLPGAITCHLRTGYNPTNTGNKWQLFHPRLVNRASGLIIAQNIAAGSITATEVNSQSFFTTDFQISTAGKIWAGSSAYGNAAGMFLGRDGSAWKFSLSDKLTWNGSVLEVNGKIKSGGSIENASGTLRINATTDEVNSDEGIIFVNNARAFSPATALSGDTRFTIDNFISGGLKGIVMRGWLSTANGSFNSVKGVYANLYFDSSNNPIYKLLSFDNASGQGSSEVSLAPKSVKIVAAAVDYGRGQLWLIAPTATENYAVLIRDSSYAEIDIGRPADKFRNGYFSGNVSAAGGFTGSIKLDSSGGNWIHQNNITAGDVFTLLSPSIPNTNDMILVSGTFRHPGGNLTADISRAQRINATTITIYIFTAQTADSFNLVQGSTTALNVSISW